MNICTYTVNALENLDILSKPAYPSNAKDGFTSHGIELLDFFTSFCFERTFSRDYPVLLDSTLRSLFTPLFPPCLTLPLGLTFQNEQKVWWGPLTGIMRKGKGQVKHPCGTFYPRQN